jgi:predicted phosphodiesterase
MKLPLRVLSDLHLGHKVSRITDAARLRPLLAGMGTVVFNGDTWQELAKPFRERSSHMLDELRWLCAEEDVETMFLPGNHDPSFAGSGFIELAGGRIVITHGDALLHAGAPWKREIIQAPERLRELWHNRPAAMRDAAERIALARDISRELQSLEYPTGRSLWQRVWDAVTPPERALWMLVSWCGQADAGADFCERYFPDAELLIVGHYHQAGCWTRRGRTIVNTGSFLNPGRAWCVDWDGEFLAWRRIDESAEHFRLEAPKHTWRIGPM